MKRLFFLSILIAAAASLAFGQCSDMDKKNLEAFDRAWGQAGEKGDQAALMTIYADDYAGLPGMLNKSKTIENTMKAFEARKADPEAADKVTPDLYLITCTPNTATITHRNVITIMNGTGGKPETVWTRSVHFLEKRGGKWQVVSNAGNGLDDYETLAYMEMDWNNAYKNRDKAWFEWNYAEDAREVDSDTGAVLGKKAFISAMLADKTTEDSVEASETDIRIDGTTAVVTSIVRTKGRDEKGQSFDRSTRYTDTFVKRDGRWMVFASQGTTIPR